MSQIVVKKIAVTFGTGLPNGTHARFKHEGKMWIAYPASKNSRILAVIDRLIGIYSRIHEDMLRWINIWPQDAERVLEVLESVKRADNLREELILEKIKAATG